MLITASFFGGASIKDALANGVFLDGIAHCNDTADAIVTEDFGMGLGFECSAQFGVDGI